MKDELRAIRKEDLWALKLILDSIDLFPSAMLEEMIYDYFHNPESEDIWFTKTINDLPVSIGYCAPEKLTDGTYNLYAIGVHKEHQRTGIGSEMMTYIEDYLSSLSTRILIVETSSDSQYKSTRQFYLSLGYTREAIISDFWKAGEDKIVFWKKL